MAPKRQRGHGSSSKAATPYDTTQFISEATSDRYHNILVGKTPILEIGLRPQENQNDLAAMIESRGWVKFTDQLKLAVVSSIQEFYTNAKETEGYVVQVHGKIILYDKARINAYYHTTDIEGNDKFTDYMAEDIDLEEVIKTLCRPGANWKSKEHEAIIFFDQGAESMRQNVVLLHLCQAYADDLPSLCR